VKDNICFLEYTSPSSITATAENAYYSDPKPIVFVTKKKLEVVDNVIKYIYYLSLGTWRIYVLSRSIIKLMLIKSWSCKNHCIDMTLPIKRVGIFHFYVKILHSSALYIWSWSPLSWNGPSCASSSQVHLLLGIQLRHYAISIMIIFRKSLTINRFN